MNIVIGLGIFILVFYLIITERIPGAWATMGGGLLMSLVGILNEEKVIEAVSERLDIIFLLVGMMIMVHLISETGVFQWFAIKIAQLVKGEPFPLVVLLAGVTALCSAFLDNVTTILLLAPVSILLANQLKLNSFVFIMTEVMAANIGGLSTIIGDPTQLIIGSQGKLSFNDFLFNTGPLAFLSFILLIGNVYIMYGRKMVVSNELKARIMELDAKRTLKDIKLLKEASVIFLIVIIGFVLNGVIDKGLAVMALSGAIILGIITKENPADLLKHVEWDTLFFFIGLFIMVNGIQEIHIIDILGNKIIELTKDNVNIAVLGVTWVSALFTSIIGNVANAATMGKIVDIMLPTFAGHEHMNMFWWALSAGSCLGGNISLLASATNVVAISTAGKAGVKITFIEFLKFGALISIQTLLLSNLYIWFRYLN
ncbi:MAG: ArsB/NhaD family transporter [Fusobacteriaceae bacterium]|nr:ArsB/NhaD family transporter [Fusobacteriaceae bacterium]